jgi:hypothetical protein
MKFKAGLIVQLQGFGQQHLCTTPTEGLYNMKDFYFFGHYLVPIEGPKLEVRE